MRVCWCRTRKPPLLELKQPLSLEFFFRILYIFTKPKYLIERSDQATNWATEEPCFGSWKGRQSVETVCKAQPISYIVGTVGPVSEGKATRAWSCLHICSAGVRNLWIYTSTTPYVFMSVLLNLLVTDFFFQILSHPVFKMWVIQKPNKVALRNKRHFEEKKWSLYSMFKIFSTDICWINIKWGI